MRSFLLKRSAVLVILAISIGGGIFGYRYFSNKNDQDQFVSVSRGDIIQEVHITGKTQPTQSVDLAFEKVGKISGVYVKVGQRVSPGQVLVEQDRSELSAQLREAEAQLQAEHALWDELKRGTRPEEIKIQEVKIENAKISLSDARRNIITVFLDAYSKADDAIRNKTDQFFSNPRGPNPEINFPVTDSQLAIDIKQERVLLEPFFAEWKQGLDSLSLSSDLILASQSARSNLLRVRSFLDKVSLVVNALGASSGISQTTVDGYRSSVATARVNVDSSLSSVSTAEEKLRGAESAVVLAENELVLKKAGTTSENLRVQEAKVNQFEAKVSNIRAQLSKAVIRSPLFGIVTKQDAQVGEIVAANAALVSVISSDLLEVEANIPEIDIGKVELDKNVRITLDAFPGEVYNGKVFFIDPAETLVDGVVNFKVKVSFNQPDPRIKSGLTTNLVIETVKKSGVLVLPAYAIWETETGVLAKKQEGDSVRDVAITIGVRGQNGLVEIISGLNEGDKVLSSSFGDK